jgi:prolipoprotein diacylglyceryltransferase
MNLFSLILGAGGSIALLRILQNSPAAQRFRWLMAGLFSMVGALLGARIGFAAAYHSYFSIHTQEIMHVTLGGLSWPGALAGGILFACLALLLFRLPLLIGLDHLSRMLLPIAAAIWLGGWQTGIAFGQLLPSGTWWGLMFRDESGLTALRVPVQPAAVISLLVVLGLIEWLMRQIQKEGLKAGVSFFVLSLHSLLFSFMRYDSVQSLLGLRLDTWAAIFFSIISSLFLAIILIRKKRLISTKETGSE